MKKNLRIVSAAAAALLAVAPVAATVAPAASTTVSAAVKGTHSDVAVPVGTFASTTALHSTFKDNARLTPAQADSLRSALGVSSNIEFQQLGSVETLNDGSVVGKVALIAKNENLSTSDIQALKNFNGGKVGDDVYVASNGARVQVNGSDVHVWVSASVKAADSSSTKILNGTSIFNADANTTVTINAVAKNGSIPSAINGGVSVTLGGKNYEALLHTDGAANNIEIYTANHAKHVAANEMTAGHYIAVIRHATVALDPQYANTTQTFTLSRGLFGSNASSSKKVTVDANGVADLNEIQVPFYAYDATKEQGVHFYEVATGNVVTSGNVTLHAVNGKLSVQSVYSALNAKYGASQFRGGLDNDPDVLKPVNDLRDQLKKQNVTVDDNGYFTAPASFSVNMNAKSNLNGATATLPVTVNVDNVTPAASQETTKTVKIMHIATIYDKNGKATHEPALRAYNTVSVVSDPVSLKDEKGNDAGKFYKLAGKDQYIKVGNVDGTSRSLKHNSYVYKSTGKRRGKTVLKKNSSVTTYGKSFMIAGHQMYRIGENQYVKKANF